MSAIDLEGLSARPMPEMPPVKGERACPLVPDFTISLVACSSRQACFTRDGDARKICFSGCAHFYQAAHEGRLETLPKRTDPASEAEEEVCPMDAPKNTKTPEFDRPLPKGAVVTATGVVKVGSNRKAPCPRCKTGWINMHGKTEACRACTTAALKAAGKPTAKAAKMRQAKAAKKSPEPMLPSMPALKDLGYFKAVGPPHADTLDHLVEEYAWQLVEMVKVRAAQLLGLKVAP